MLNPQLKDKVAIVTGANHGIGAATAKVLAKQGVKVLLNYLRIPESDQTAEEQPYKQNRAQTADSVLEEISREGGIAKAYEGDLSQLEFIPQLFDQAEQLFGPVQILVNNAAACQPDTFNPHTSVKEEKTGQVTNTITLDKYEAHFNVNTRATVFMIEEFAQRLKDQQINWGRIINLSTDWADCFPTSISYGASKAATESYSRSAAVELGKYGITVNIVAPGPIQTGWMSPDVETNQAKNCPLGRIGTPEDVADVIVFLASHQARWLTGQRLFVGGGNRII